MSKKNSSTILLVLVSIIEFICVYLLESTLIFSLGFLYLLIYKLLKLIPLFG